MNSAREPIERYVRAKPVERANAGDRWNEIIGYTGPGSMTWRIGCEWAMLLGAGRAVFLQLAHPLVAAGVAQHSTFDVDPIGRSVRTVEFTQVMAFGTRFEAHAMARSVNRLHAGVVGELGSDVGNYRADTSYRARDPELLLWVYATLVDTALTLYPQLIGSLNRAEQRRYYAESRRTTALLGLPRDLVPRTLDAFEDYFQGMLAGSALSVTPQARELGHGLLYLPAPAPIRALEPLGELLTAGFLPSCIRDEYGLAWGGARQRVFDIIVTSVRAALPLLPPSARYTPWSRRAAARIELAAAAANLGAEPGADHDRTR